MLKIMKDRYFCILFYPNLGKNESNEYFTHKTVNGVDSLLITLCMLGNFSYFVVL